MIAILENGHGINTPGKCAPDKSVLEWQYSRRLTDAICKRLKAKGIKTRILVHEETDVPLAERVRLANNIYAEDSDSFLVSNHLNAAGADGKWHNATGYSVWVSSNASSKSKKLARCLYEEAEKRNLKGNRCVPTEKYWTSNFYILRNTRCPAVLIEHAFQDSKSDVEFLLSDKGFETLVDAAVSGIVKYIEETK